jgi:NADPH-dependent glutamate synthase beta subunit-like oxidoreductase
MLIKGKSPGQIPLFLPCSSASSHANKTGSWRFFQPLPDEKTAPCSNACPAGEDIGRIEMLLGRGLIDDAWQTIMAENPLPSICGRVCFHPCESVCNRTLFDQAVAVHMLERRIGDLAIQEKLMPAGERRPSNGKRIAVIGSGPSGLAAAYFLARLGYACTVFEAQAEPGGLLRWGIPAYRLPRQVAAAEIQRIAAMGVDIRCNTPVDAGRIATLREKHDALFIGTGLKRPVTMNIPGENWAIDGLQFLQQLRSGRKAALQGPVAVIGGGNTAIDLARSLLRLGAEALVVYRRRREDMPAFEPELAMALEEGVELKELRAPTAIEKINASPSHGPEVRLTLQAMQASPGKIGGRARAIPIEGHTETLRVRYVFRATGAGSTPAGLLRGSDDQDYEKFSHCRFAGGRKPLVLGGDLATPLKTVTDAIASGKQAAMLLDTCLQEGSRDLRETLAACRVGTGPVLSMEGYLGGARAHRNRRIVAYEDLNADYFEAAVRAVPDRIELNGRRHSFDEIDATLPAEKAAAEADRCFNCGICNACDNCRLFCPEIAVVVENGRRRIDLDFCKGCGICVTECPRSAMAMEEEK